ncbi:ADP-ribosylation factor, putative [Leishmania tarentolae]|uniref:ADP-ribosylation factor, putative n=1 Tax=Leishmania tarentolae TaxID=5689 RepID=A0A640KDQ4_LEITA|nr:ADP-ribosylation factor, putative [Leishmania tarentolae]
MWAPKCVHVCLCVRSICVYGQVSRGVSHTPLSMVTLDVLGDPVHGLAQRLAGRGTAPHECPRAVLQLPKFQVLDQLGWGCGGLDILLVGQHEKSRVLERWLVVQKLVQHRFCRREFLSISRVNNEENGVRMVVVELPRLAQLLLPTQVPAGEGDGAARLRVREDEGFRVAAEGGLGGDGVTQLQVIQNGRLSGIAQAKDEQLVGFVALEQAPQAGEELPHPAPLFFSVDQTADCGGGDCCCGGGGGGDGKQKKNYTYTYIYIYIYVCVYAVCAMRLNVK